MLKNKKFFELLLIVDVYGALVNFFEIKKYLVRKP